jgi:hypothetical protein
MIKKIKIGKFKFSFVLRHRWEKNIVNRWTERRKVELGIWIRWYRAVHSITRDPKINLKTYNFPNVWLFGLSLLVCTMWVEISFNSLSFEI